MLKRPHNQPGAMPNLSAQELKTVLTMILNSLAQQAHSPREINQLYLYARAAFGSWMVEDIAQEKETTP